MATVTIDSEMASNVAANVALGRSLTYAFTNTAGTCLIIGVVCTNTAVKGPLPIPPVTGVYYAGVKATKLDSQGYETQSANNNKTDISLWIIRNPATGANNVVINTVLDDASTYTGILSGALSVTNAGRISDVQKNVMETANTSATVVVPGTVLTSSMIVALMAAGSGYVSTGQTLSCSKNVATTTSGNNIAMTRTAGTGADITMTNTVTSDFRIMIAIEIFGSITDTTYKARYSNRKARRSAQLNRRRSGR